MTILFAGGEEGELLKTSTACTVDTATTAARRTNYSRCSLKVASHSATEGWVAKFSAAATSFWVSARHYMGGSGSFTAYGRGIVLMDGAVGRLHVGPANIVGNNSLYNLNIGLWKVNAAGTTTLLATSGYKFPMDSTMSKWDIQVVNWGATATVRVYLENNLILTYQGDVTTDGSTSITGVRFGQFTGSAYDTAYWSEMMAATVDTRTLTLATLAPAAAGNSYAWSGGAYSALNETTLDDQGLAYSTVAGQVLETTITNSTVPAVAGVVGVVVNARAQKGNTGGPANANLVVRTGGADYTSPSAALPTGAFDLVSYTWETNPATSAVWVPSDITAATFNIGVKSLA